MAKPKVKKRLTAEPPVVDRRTYTRRASLGVALVRTTDQATGNALHVQVIDYSYGGICFIAPVALDVDDLAAACLLLIKKYDSPEIINVGCGEDVTIRELAELICDEIGFDGELVWDKTKPDGTPRKLLDVTRIRALGWQPTIPLRKGIAQTYQWFLANWSRK